MKKTITGAVALLAGAFVAYSQGTVFFGNYSDLSPYIYVSYKGTKLGGAAGATTGSPASDVANGNDWSVALYGAPGSGDAPSALSQLQTGGSSPVPVVATLANGATDATAGTWYSGLVGVVPGSGGAGNGDAVSIQILSWYNDGGTLTYAQALAAGDPTGASLVENYTTGGPQLSGPPVTAPDVSPAGLGNIVLSPEPSTVALGVMGASAFLMRLRRKK
jgi:hypothetical protein